MKNTTEEMILAALVRQQAVEILRDRTQGRLPKDVEAYWVNNRDALVGSVVQDLSAISGVIALHLK